MILFGWITLLVFPIPGFCLQYYFNQTSFLDFIALDDFRMIPLMYGLQLGIVYGFIAYLFMKAPILHLSNQLPPIRPVVWEQTVYTSISHYCLWIQVTS